MTRAHSQEISPRQGFTENRLDRRQLLKFIGGASAAFVLSGCGGESPAGMNNARAEGAPSDSSNEEISAAIPGEETVERLGIDIKKLPLDAIYADREDRNPERVREVYERCKQEVENGTGTYDEFVELFQTKEDEVYPGGVFDVHAAGHAFAYRLEMALNAFCHPDYLEKYVDFPDDGSFTREMTRQDVMILMVRGLGGYTATKYTDQDVVSSELYSQFAPARKVALDNYIRNAQRPGGNLNESVRVIPGECYVKKDIDPIYLTDLPFTLTNKTDVSHGPEHVYEYNGSILVGVYPPEEGSDAVMYGPDKNPNVITPLDELASAA